MAETFKIIDTRRIPSPDADRVGRLDYLVTYQLDPLRTFIVRIPVDDLTEEIIRDHVRKDLDSMKRFAGREFSL